MGESEREIEEKRRSDSAHKVRRWDFRPWWTHHPICDGNGKWASLFFCSLGFIRMDPDNVLCDTKQCAWTKHMFSFSRCVCVCVCMRVRENICDVWNFPHRCTITRKTPIGTKKKCVSHFVVRRHVKHFKYLLEMLILILVGPAYCHSKFTTSWNISNVVFSILSLLSPGFGHRFRLKCHCAASVFWLIL